MNILLMGFSTTGKSSILKSLKEKQQINIEFIDSDSEISVDYQNSISNLFIDLHKDEDPENRNQIMSEIEYRENTFLFNLMSQKETYIAALGPNIHTRKNWITYYQTTKPFVIFLKANVDDVYKGLIRREDEFPEQMKCESAFGNWNHGVIRKYNASEKTYTRLSEKKSKENILNLINVNESYYSTIANITFEANTLFDWHSKFDPTKKSELFEIIKAKISEK